MNKIQEYQEVIEFLNNTQMNYPPDNYEINHDYGILPEFYKKILLLSKHELINTSYIHEDLQSHFESVLNYILDNLHCFNITDFSDIDVEVEFNVFIWDVTNDPVLPYLLGLTPKTFKAYFESIHGPINSIIIRLFYEDYFLENKEIWRMNIFDVNV